MLPRGEFCGTSQELAELKYLKDIIDHHHTTTADVQVRGWGGVGWGRVGRERGGRGWGGERVGWGKGEEGRGWGGERVGSGRKGRKGLSLTPPIQVLRSADQWSVGIVNEHSILNAYIETIKKAEHFIYIEVQ